MDQTRVHRLLRLLTLIQSAPDWDAPKLAGEFGVDVRTIYRDIRGLAEVGLPCRYSRADGGYRACDGVFLPPVQLSVEEALSLAVLCEKVARDGSIPFLGAACRAIEKLRSVLPTSTREEVRAMLEGVHIKTAAAADPMEARDVYDRLATAVHARAVVRCTYESLAASREFRLHPYALFFCVRAWYVVGLHAGHGELRTLKLNRFASVTATQERFTRPADFSVERYLGNAWRMVRGADVDVELWFDPAFAPTVSDTIWHASQSVDHHADGSMTFRCRVAGLDEIVWWVLSMGPHCVVRSPKELAQRVSELAGEVISLYGKKGAANRMAPGGSARSRAKPKT